MKQKIINVFIILIILIGLNLIISNKSYATMASGTVGKYNCPWEITDDGELIIHEGTIEVNSSLEWSWSSYKDDIKKVTATENIVCKNSLYYIFYKFNNCEEINLSGFNTDNVTNMSYMLFECFSLKSLDISNFNTSNVTNMKGMFYKSKKLLNLDVSKFDTSKVTDMSSMFIECNLLTILDVSKFNTSNVTDMSCMFGWCNSLKNIDVTHFDTSKVTDMSEMFLDCKSLTSLDITKFDTSKVTDMSCMFQQDSSLTNLDVTKFDTSNVTNMGSMFIGCSLLTNLDVSKFDTSNVIYMQSMFGGCEALNTIDVTNFNTSKVVSMRRLFSKCKSLKSIDLTKFDTSNVEDMGYMFFQCTSFKDIDLTKFNTLKVKDMSYMFYNCSSLINIDLTKFNTLNVTTMQCMFSGCELLTNIDVSKFNTSNVTDMACMFDRCYSLLTIDLSNFDTSKVTDMWVMFTACNNLNEVTLGNKFKFVGTTNYLPFNDWVRKSNNEIVKDLWNNYKCDTMADTYIPYSLYAILYESGELHFQVGSKEDSSKGNVLKKYKIENSNLHNWTENSSKITKVTSDNFVCPNDISSWFSGCTNLREVDLSNFDTKNVTNMNYLFNNCSNISLLKLGSNFNFVGTTNYLPCIDWVRTSNNEIVKNLWNNYKCDTMVDTYTPYSLYAILYESGELHFQVGSKENTTKGNVLKKYLIGSINNHGWTENSSKITKVTSDNFVCPDDISFWFSECTNLEEVDLSNFDTKNVTNMNYLFSNCSNISLLKLGSNFNFVGTTNYLPCTDWVRTSNNEIVKNLWNNYKCDTMVDIYTPYSLYAILYELGELHFQVGSKEDTTKGNVLKKYIIGGTNNHGWTENSSKIIKVTSDNFVCPDDISFWFSECTNLEEVDLSNFDTKDVTNMDDLFDNCSNISILKLGNKFKFVGTTNYLPCTDWIRESNKEKITDLWNSYKSDSMSGTYTPYGIYAILYESGELHFQVGSKTSLLKGGVIKKYLIGSTNNHGWTENSSKITKVTSDKIPCPQDISSWFASCSNLIDVDISNFDTSNVINMSSLFFDCSSLTKLNLNELDTSKVEDMSSMFYLCYSLTELKIDKLDTSKVEDMSYMFSDCTSITEVEIDNFNTKNVTTMSNMFASCKSLTKLNFNNFDTNNVTDMSSMFYCCEKLKELDLTNFNTNKVTDMSAMFTICSSLENLNLTNFNTSNVTDMNSMFAYCNLLTKLDLTNFNTSNVTNMSYMFTGCKNLLELNIDNFDTSNVVYMDTMFTACFSLTNLNLRSFSLEKLESCSLMFAGFDEIQLELDAMNGKYDEYISNGYFNDFDEEDWLKFYIENGYIQEMKLKTILISDKWKFSSETYADSMFLYDSNLVGGFGTKCDENYTNGEYAFADSDNQKGYLTNKILINIEELNDSNIEDSNSKIEVNYDDNENVNVIPNLGYEIINISDNGEIKEVNSREKYIYELKNIKEYHKIEVITEPSKYKIIYGDNQERKEKKTEDLTITSDGLFEIFTGLEINGKELVKDKDYKVKKGSTIVTISKDYLDTLEKGDYEIKFKYSNGSEPVGTMKIAEENIVTETSNVDNSNTGITLYNGGDANNGNVSTASKISTAISKIVNTGDNVLKVTLPIIVIILFINFIQIKYKRIESHKKKPRIGRK